MTRRAARCLVLVVAALGGPAAAAQAAPPWSAAQDLSAPHLFVDDARIAAGGDGSALAWWSWQDGTGASARAAASLASRAPGATAFGAQRAAPSGLADLAAYGRSRAVAVVQRPLGGQRSRVAVAFGRMSGRFDAARTVAAGPRLRRPLVAANADGDAALAYWQDRGTNTDRVYVSLRAAGGRFATPVRLTEGRIRSIVVAVGPDGDVIVAWNARSRVEARFRPAGARRFASTEVVRSEPTYFADLHAAVTGGGRAYLAWSAQFRSEGGDAGPVTYEAAVRPVGGRFRAAQLLERQGAQRPQGGIGLAAGAGRDATVAWTGFDGATARVRAAVTGAGGSFGAGRDVSPAGEEAVVSDLAAARDGTRIVIWDNGGFDANEVRAAVAAAGQPFGAPEDVSAAQEARAGRAAFAGGPTVVWSNRPAGSHPPGGIGAIRTFAQAATRP
jgi:hypothetical protein